MKFCTTCRKLKEESEFIKIKYRQTDGRVNIRVRCIDCASKTKRVRRVR